MEHVPRKNKKLRTGRSNDTSSETSQGVGGGGQEGQGPGRGQEGGQGSWSSHNRANQSWSGHGSGLSGSSRGHHQGWNPQAGGRHNPHHAAGPPQNNPPLDWFGRNSHNNNNYRPVQAMPSPSTAKHYGTAGGHYSQPESLIGALRADEAPDQGNVTSDIAPVLRFGLVPTTEEWFDTKDMIWESLNHTQKIKYLIPRMKNSGRPDSPDISFFRQLPPEILQSEFMSEKRKEKMKAAIEAALVKLHQFFVHAADFAKENDETEEEHNDSDVSDGFSDGEWVDPYKRKDPGFEWGGFLSEGFAINFIKGLSKHALFTASFDASGSDEAHSQLCHCPCSTKKSLQWLKLIGFDGITEGKAYQARFNACNNRKATFRHYALLAHLQALDDDPLHRGILVYITELYKSHYGPDFHHEALYKNVDDVKFNNVIAFKTRRLETKLADMRAAQRKYRERSDKSNTVARPEIQKNRAIYDNLNMVGHDKFKNLPREVIKKQVESYDKFLLLMLRANGVKPGVPNGEYIDSEDMDQVFDISKIFDGWHSKVRGADKSCLFRELDEITVKKVLSKGQWNFKAIAETDKGVDEGGLTRMFFEKCWAQVGRLAVTVGAEDTRIALFEEEACGVNPFPDDIVLSRICNAFKILEGELDGHDGARQALNKVQIFYRAVGRIMCHSLATNHILPCNLLPGILRSYLFCSKKPSEKDYPAQELFPHLKELDLLKGFQAVFESGDELRAEADSRLIEARSHALHSILEGLTLDSNVDFNLFFEGKEVQLLDEIIFAPSTVTAEMIIDVLEYCILSDSTSGHSKDFNQVQRVFVNETMPGLLRKKEALPGGPEFLREFLRHTTGLSYINRRNPQIRICFEDLKLDTALPVAHTCEQELCFPLTAYEADVDRLDYYLDIAMRNSVVPGFEITMS